MTEEIKKILPIAEKFASNFSPKYSGKVEYCGEFNGEPLFHISKVGLSGHIGMPWFLSVRNKKARLIETSDEIFQCMKIRFAYLQFNENIRNVDVK